MSLPHRLDFTTPYAEHVPAPKPWPDRDWAAMPGVLLTPDRIRSMKRDSLHRDAYGITERVATWEKINRWHMEARETNRGLPPDTGPYLFSGDMGTSKSHLMVTYALQAWANRAVPVFSVPSVGALFGYLLTYEEMYDFADSIPPGSILIIDEIAALLDVYTSKANRGRTLHAGLTSFRKGGTLLLTATAHEARVSWEMKSSYRAVIKPERRYPAKRVVTARHHFTCEPTKYKLVYLRANELKYPPFCYVQARGLIAPWAGRKVFEDYDSYLADMQAGNRNGAQGDTKWKEVPVTVPTEGWMALGAQLYDTFERVPTSDPFGIDSKRMHDHWGTQKGDPMGRFLAAAVEQGTLGQVHKAGWVAQDVLRDLAVEFDPARFKGISAGQFRSMLEKAVGAVKVGRRSAVTERRVAVGAIEQAVKGVGK